MKLRQGLVTPIHYPLQAETLTDKEKQRSRNVYRLLTTLDKF